MTVSSTSRRAGPFYGNGVTTAFPFAFKVFAASDLQLTHTNAAGVDSVITSGFSVALNADQDANPGGTITYPLAGSPMANPESLVAVSTLAYKQGTDLTNAGRFLPQSLEDALDYQNMLIQQLVESTERTLTFPVSDGAPASATLPALAQRRGKFFAFDAGGTPIGSSGTGADAGLRTDLAAPSGPALVGHDATLNYVAGTLGAALGATLNVMMFPWVARGDGTDDSARIQAAIDSIAAAGGGTVFFPQPTTTYGTTVPLRLPANVCLVGMNPSVSITKTGTTAGTGTALARAGTVTDSYVVDAIVQLIHLDNQYTYYAQIEKLKLIKAAYAASSFGVYAPRASHIKLKDVLVQNCTVGYYSFDSWMGSLEDVTVQACAIGFQHANDGSGNATGTSLTFKNCWCNFDNTVCAPVDGFALFGLKYSNLISCGSDNAIRLDGAATYAYFFNSCTGIVLSGCGAENSKGGVISVSSSSVTAIDLVSLAMTGVAAGTVGTVFADSNSTLTLIGCNFGVTTTPGVLENFVIQNNSKVIEINSGASPSGAGAFISYSGGSSRTVIDGTGTMRSDATGNYTRPDKFGGFFTGVAATPVTLATVAAKGMYMVHAWVNNSGTNYDSVALVTTDGVTAQLTVLKAGASLPITLSGFDIQVTPLANCVGNWTIGRQLQ